jgi:hypothetical protein
MTKMVRTLVIAVLAAALAACASVQRLDAAQDVHALLIAIRDNDQAAFDAHVDRPALKQDLTAKLNQRIDKRLRGWASVLGPSVADFASETLVQPQVFKLVAKQYGYTPETPIPNVIEIAGALKPLDDSHVCAVTKKGGPCLMTFAKEQGVWKLTRFDGDFSMLSLKL